MKNKTKRSEKDIKMSKKNQEGITLVALVVTIIILIILAAISINALIGDDGLIKKAIQAKQDTERESAKEQQILDGRMQVGGIWYDSISDYIAGNQSKNQSDSTGNTGGNNTIIKKDEKFSEIYEENTTITQGAYKAVVPKGYAVGTSDGINKIEDGLVITDAVDGKKNSTGNEFVWLPVKKPVITEEEIATLRANDETLTTDLLAVQSLVDAGIFPMAVQVGENYQGLLYDFGGRAKLTAEVYDWTDTSLYREPMNLTGYYNPSGYTVDAREEFIIDSQDIFTMYGLGTYTDTLYQEAYNNMVDSVVKNGGFYVGRYEISEGTYTNSENNIVSYAQTKANEESISKDWHDIYKYGREYAKSIDNLGVTSEMLWKSQWGQMLVFVHGKKDIEGYPFCVTIEGNRKDSDYITGNNELDQVANIFDLESGIREWTQGGYLASSSAGGPMRAYASGYGWASSNGYFSPFIGAYVGGRVTLYVTN